MDQITGPGGAVGAQLGLEEGCAGGRRWEKVNRGRQRKGGDAEPDAERRLLRLSAPTAEQFESQLCVKPLSSTSLRHAEGPRGRALTNLFHITRPFSLPHRLCIRLFICLFASFFLTLGRVSLRLPVSAGDAEMHTDVLSTRPHEPLLTRWLRPRRGC